MVGRRFFMALDAARKRSGVALMGILNVTPDSFSDGGRYASAGAARARIDELVAQGVDVLDVGGESTRPGAPRVGAALQIERVLPAVRYAAERVCVSVDTTDGDVAAAAIEAGASVVNDVSLLSDERLARACAETGAALVLSHARGRQDQMAGFSVQPASTYRDVVRDVVADWEAAAERARSLGVVRESLVMDPGLGFTKSAAHSLELLRRLDEVVAAVKGVPVLVGASRKSFLAIAAGDAAPADRLGASVAAALAAWRSGAAVLRVHDVRATRQAVDMARALGAGEVP
jgi:dihydropteroate synthase